MLVRNCQMQQMNKLQNCGMCYIIWKLDCEQAKFYTR